MEGLVVFLLCLLGFVAAERNFTASSAVGPGETYSIILEKDPNYVPQSVTFTEIYMQPFLKYGQTPPDALAAAWEQIQAGNASVAPRDVGTVESQGLYNFPIQIGTPAQTIPVLFDTGSGDLWVRSWLDSSSTAPYYDARLSSTASLYGGQSFDNGYGSGTAQGCVYLDTFAFDTSVYGPLSASDEPIEVATSVGGAFSSSLSDTHGVFGLSMTAYDNESPTPQQTWLDFSMPYFPSGSQVFTVEMFKQRQATVDFGYTNSSKYSGSIMWTPAGATSSSPTTGLVSGLWWFQTTGYKVGSGTYTTTNTQAFADTGGNIAYMPAAMTTAYYSTISGSVQGSDGSWTFPCATTLPSITFGLGGSQTITISPAGFIFQQVSGTMCYGAVQPGGSYIYFSEPFYYGTFVIHDYQYSRLGFATRTAL